MSALGLLLTLAGCQDRELSWSYRLTTDELSSSTVLIEIGFVEGSCEGEPISNFSFSPGAESPVPLPTLGPGEWGFRVEAFDLAGASIGQGCELVTLPIEGDGAVLVEVGPPVDEDASPSQDGGVLDAD